MKNISELKKNILDIFDIQYFGKNVDETNVLLNTVGKVNVGWNVNYIKSLPEYDLLIDVGAADDFEMLHSARPNATSILIDANQNYSKIYQSFFKNRTGYYEIVAVGEKSEVKQYTLYHDAPYLSTIGKRSDYVSNNKSVYDVNVKKIDDIVDIKISKKGALLKLDIEGFELQALKGAKDVLNICNNVICEVSISDDFPGGNNFDKINELMLKNDFKIKDILRVPRVNHNSYPAQVLDVVYGK